MAFTPLNLSVQNLNVQSFDAIDNSDHAAFAANVVLINEYQQPLADLPDTLANRVQTLLNNTAFDGKLASTIASFEPAPLVLVGVGKRDKLGGNAVQKLAKTVYSSLSKYTTHARVWLGDGLDSIMFGQFALALANAAYQFTDYLSQAKSTADHTNEKGSTADAPRLTHIELLLKTDTIATYQNVLDFNVALHHGQSLARDLGNMPPNDCNPAYFVQQAQALAKQYPDVLQVKVIGEREMAELGMNCFLAVSNGSTQEGQLVLLEYRGAPDEAAVKAPSDVFDQAPFALVGKGITFDSGGISIKPGLGMGEMKFDMSGAGSVLGTMAALCQARLPINVVGALACAENMPSGQATRPGDIVRAMDGTSVEILNTDAEGRLVLCDSLLYVQRYQPRVIIDVATLTGACIVALGHIRSGLYSNDEDVIFDLEQASQEAHDRVWHMPLDDDYQEQLKSKFADVQNIGGAPAGSVTAACFLARFVENVPWAHLDVAGTAWQTGKEAASTGRPVPLLMHYLNRQVKLAQAN